MKHHDASAPRQLTVFLSEGDPPPRTYLVYFKAGSLRFLDSGKLVQIPPTATAVIKPLESSMDWIPHPKASEG